MPNKSVSLSECDIQYLVDGNGPSLVCLHPASGSRITPALEELMRTFRVYLPVVPGFDGTPLSPRSATMQQLGSWIGEFVDSVIGTSVHVSGHSFGGWVASWLAVLRPDVVGSLVLQCPAGFGPLVKAEAGANPAALLARTYAHPERRRKETKSDEVIAANRKLAGTYMGELVSDGGLIARLGEEQAKTLVLQGRKDGVVPLEGALLLEKLIPRATLVLLDDAAHNLEVDQPEEYARLVRDFLTAEELHA